MKLLRFAIVGGSVAGFYVLLYTGLNAAGVPQQLSNACAFGAAICLQYIGQASFTFGAPLRDQSQIMRFAVMVALGYGVSIAVTGGLAPQWHLPDWLAALIVAIVLPIQNFILMTLWVFVSHQKLGG